MQATASKRLPSSKSAMSRSWGGTFGRRSRASPSSSGAAAARRRGVAGSRGRAPRPRAGGRGSTRRPRRRDARNGGTRAASCQPRGAVLDSSATPTKEDGMATVTAGQLDTTALEGQVRGELISPEDPGYDEARRG